MSYIGYVPAAKPLTSADITDSIITSAKITDGTITNTDVASSIITGQTAETSIAGGDSILIYDDSVSALRKMTRTNFVAGVGGANTPAFEATLGSNQSIPALTLTKLQLNTESFDTDGCYDNSTNYRFTPTSSGKYFCYGTYYGSFTGGDDMLMLCKIVKNGGTTNNIPIEPTIRVKTDDVLTIQAQSIVTLNGSTDYVEFYVLQYDYVTGAAADARGNTSGRQFCNFGAFKLSGA